MKIIISYTAIYIYKIYKIYKIESTITAEYSNKQKGHEVVGSETGKGFGSVAIIANSFNKLRKESKRCETNVIKYF